MAFIETLFPITIAYGGTGGPQFSTDMTITFGGFEQRNINWQDTRGIWDVGQIHRTQAETDTLIAFFRAVAKGKANSFRFRDLPTGDITGTDEPIGTGDGTKTAFQLIKRYTTGGQTFDRTIAKPVTGTTTIKFDGVNQPTGWTVDTTTGIVTFNTAPASSVVVTASFTFDVPVRFDTDVLRMQRLANDVYSWESIMLVEVRDIT